jgi:hypothetical protein
MTIIISNETNKIGKPSARLIAILTFTVRRLTKSRKLRKLC